ncbi:MAG: lipoyl(octanoyl) transferase LipB [Phycisphaeraceae bacterium]|nr:lipoyl(octanoyl) transferase LipB [Phycisphaeraceae bacterium]
MPIPVVDLGRMEYAAAYRVQCEHHAAVLAERESGATGRAGGRILLVEHDPPVITISRRPGARAHLLATDQMLALHGVRVAETDRGGDITYHGPGQLVVYPIIDLNFFGLRLHDYMRLLEQAVIETLAEFGVRGERDATATGVWVPRVAEVAAPGAGAAKICAMGVRIRRWVSLHGLALNVTTNLEHFGLIVPCGLVGRPVTSLRQELGESCPDMARVKVTLAGRLGDLIDSRRGSLCTEFDRAL